MDIIEDQENIYVYGARSHNLKNIDLSISYTTRQKRINEKEGRDYFFVSLKSHANSNEVNILITDF